MKVFAILAAAGTGRRYKESQVPNRKHWKSSALPKQFLKLRGKPIILYSLLALQESRHVDWIVIAADPRHFNLINRIVLENNITKFLHFGEGGETRFQSVRNAFMSLNSERNDLVLIHDAARPLVTAEDVDKILIEAKRRPMPPGLVCGRKIEDTIKKAPKGIIKETISRENLWAVQTPQVFQYQVLMHAYRFSRKPIVYNYTDESSMVEEAGFKVRIIEVNSANIKITIPEDLITAARLL